MALFVVDIVLINGAFVLAYFMRENWHGFYSIDLFPSVIVMGRSIASMSAHLWLLLLIVPIWEGMLLCAKIFRPSRTAGFIDTIWTVAASVFVATGIFGALAFALRLTFMSRGFIMIFVALSILFLSVERCAFVLAFRILRRRNRNLNYVLVVGTGPRARVFIEDMETHPEWGMRVVGLVDKDSDMIGRSVAGHTVIGGLCDISRLLIDNVVDLVVFVVPRDWIGQIGESIRHCKLQGVDVQVTLDLFEYDIGQVRLGTFGRFPVLALESIAIHPFEAAIKRGLDIVGSALLLILLAPVFFAIILAIKLDSRGPVVYAQRRHGLRGREFSMLKFRTMVRNADGLLDELRLQNEMSGAAFKLADDPRVTRVGRFLRRFSLDELPQLLNVLKGDMSIVGPRPLIASEKDKYEEWQRRRMSLRPGLTCLWQVDGRNEIGFEHWMQLDLEYIDHWSLWTDFKIVVKTLPAVLHGRGAY